MLVEVGMDSHRHVMTNTHHGTKGVGTEAQVSILTHVLKALTLLLHRIIATAETVNFNAFALDFNTLSGTLTFNQSTYCTDAGASGNLTELILIRPWMGRLLSEYY